MYGSFGSAMPKSCISFVSRASHDAGIKEKYGLQRIVYPVHGCRQIGKPHMVLNGNMPKIDVNPETFEVFIDGRQAYVKPAQKFSLAQLYWFS
jgi:urease subunit alpha